PWLPTVCILGFCFSGCFSIQGPEFVRAPEQGFVTVQCHYKRIPPHWMTMEGLRRDDEGIYWCGIERTGTDLGTRVKVIVDREGAASTTASSPANSNMGVFIGSHKRNHYMLLVFVKVPILLILVTAILWLKGSQRVPEEPGEQPEYMNFSDLLTKDMAA
uniref:CD300 molecule like family member b n=1 Tax=Nomascus leucogenys TaxID=61853 RepID=G1QPA0_NOMLE